MIKWFKMLFHFHEWDLKEHGPYTYKGDFGHKQGKYYNCICKVCGKPKMFKVF